MTRPFRRLFATACAALALLGRSAEGSQEPSVSVTLNPLRRGPTTTTAGLVVRVQGDTASREIAVPWTATTLTLPRGHCRLSCPRADQWCQTVDVIAQEGLPPIDLAVYASTEAHRPPFMAQCPARASRVTIQARSVAKRTTAFVAVEDCESHGRVLYNKAPSDADGPTCGRQRLRTDLLLGNRARKAS